MKEKYIITPTVERQERVLGYLESLGYTWASGQKLTDVIPMNERPDEMVLYLRSDKTVTKSSIQYLGNNINKYEEIKVDDVDKLPCNY